MIQYSGGHKRWIADVPERENALSLSLLNPLHSLSLFPPFESVAPLSAQGWGLVGQQSNRPSHFKNLPRPPMPLSILDVVPLLLVPLLCSLPIIWLLRPPWLLCKMHRYPQI